MVIIFFTFKSVLAVLAALCLLLAAAGGGAESQTAETPNESPPAEPVPAETPETADDPVPENEVIGTAKATQKKVPLPDPEEPEDKYARVGRYNGFEKVVEIFRDADAHPDRYTWDMLTTSAWRNMIPSLKDVTLHSVAHVVGNIVKHGITVKEVRYNPSVYLNENVYRLPVPKEEAKPQETSVPARNPEDVKLGAILRKARMDAGLSVKDLSQGIGYDVPIIVNWESGLYHMAKTALDAIHNLFKRDIFATKEEASA